MSAVTLPYPPSVNRYWRNWRGRMVLSAEARAYKLAVGVACRKSLLRPLAGPLRVELEVLRPRHIGDLDNALKAVLDALKGHAYVDDHQVVELHAWRLDDKANPRVEVRVATMPEDALALVGVNRVSRG